MQQSSHCRVQSIVGAVVVNDNGHFEMVRSRIEKSQMKLVRNSALSALLARVDVPDRGSSDRRRRSIDLILRLECAFV